MPKVEYLSKSFDRKKYDLLSEDEYFFIKKNYNSFVNETHSKNKAELKIKLSEYYSYKSTLKLLTTVAVIAAVINIISLGINLPKIIHGIYGIGFLISIGGIVSISNSRSLTKDQYNKYFRDLNDYYYFHRETIEETNSYDHYCQAITHKSKNIINKLFR